MTITKETGKKVEKRQSNFELLRIFAMLLAIAHHFSVHGGFDFPMDYITIPRLWIQFIEMGGKVCVNIFVLIAGYFLIDVHKIQVSKIIRLWLQLFTYSLIIYLLTLALGIEEFSIKELIKSVFPVSFSMWWFVSTYIVLYILSPFINDFLHVLSKRAYQSFILLIFIMWCIVPTFLSSSLESNNLLWFIFLYAIAGYIRLWNNDSSRHSKVYYLAAICLSLLTFLTVIVFDFIGKKIPFVGMHANFFYGMQKLPILLISLAIFIGFKNLKMGYHKIVNLIATSTFGIYLIHDNKWIREILWIRIFKNTDYADTTLIIPYSIAVICVVFVVCGGIELIRIHLFEKKYMKIIDKHKAYWSKIIEKVSQQVYKLFSLF